MNPPARATGKVIAVFSDGTGNSAAKLNKTNVWRLYEALDLTPDARQIALYDDGVGTSGFRPLALLGGVFGYGLARNVLDLYKFLCRNYVPGDRIFAFGFSRGAFTVRVLMGLVLRVGLVPYHGEKDLELHAKEAYRRYRENFQSVALARLARRVRDGVIRAWRTAVRATPMPPLIEVKEVAFVGVWDTVAAYGMPVAEMTRAVDRWIWPLSMPNYILSKKVTTARHALALDDERDTFHPLLWDEVAEAEMIAAGDVAPGRLQQVWFAGMHSDVGGGYADDSLSYVSLEWMMKEASASGLRLRRSAFRDVLSRRNAFGPIHDSRAGLGSYYRYQPRRLVARLDPPHPDTLLMRDPHDKRGLLRQVTVHDSVLQRIANGPDGYAPIVLPPDFKVQDARGRVRNETLGADTEPVWNLVWQRRANYFVSIVLTLLFLLMPLLPSSDCEGPQCLVSPAVSAGGELLPDMLRPWVKAWADHPALFLVLIVLLATTRSAGRRLQRSIDDRMSDAWAATLGGPLTATKEGFTAQWVQRLRKNRIYQRSLQWLKWRFAPTSFAMAYFVMASVVATTLAHRIPLAFIDVHDTYCKASTARDVPTAVPTQAAGEFPTDAPCWSTGLQLEEGASYRLALTIIEPWKDLEHPASPAGFASTQFGVLAPWAAPLRRSTTTPWFAPMLSIRDAQSRSHSFAIEVAALEPSSTGAAGDVYTGTFKAPASGHGFLFVNDAVLPWWPADKPWFYANNKGAARVTLQRLANAAAP